jgi:hypothetical protein
MDEDDRPPMPPLEQDPLDDVLGSFPGLSAAADVNAERDSWDRR